MRPRPLALSAAVLALAWAAAAHASDRIYWSNHGADSIAFAALDGSGGGTVDTGGVPVNLPAGIALDPEANRIYWASTGLNTIAFAGLSGEGGGTLATGAAPTNSPQGLAINPAAGTLYWANTGPGSIAVANLDSSGGGALSAPANGPQGVALNTSNGRLYFADYNANKIRFARLNGAGGGTLPTPGATVSGPVSVAVDPDVGRIYWSNLTTNSISYAKLDGSGGGALDTSGAPVASPHGIALDLATGRIYWENVGTSQIAYASVLGGGGGVLDTSGATIQGSSFLAILRAPAPNQPPVITSPGATSGSAPSGSVLSCSQGVWGGNLLGAGFYRAPQRFAFQWSRDGAEVVGATDVSYTADLAGTYTCAVSAANAAGTTKQTSIGFTIPASANPPSTEPSNRFEFGKLKRNRKRGTARLAVDLPGPGRLELGGRDVVGRNARASSRRHRFEQVGNAGEVKLLIKARGRARTLLRRDGSTKLHARVTYTPTGGDPNTQKKNIKLVRSD